MKHNQTRKPRFVCGIDFGTTFTSVAFAHSKSPDTVKMVLSWPSATNSSSDDVPSELFYINHLSSPRQLQWGFQIPKTSKTTPEPLKWFKLLLQQHTASDGGFGGHLTFLDRPTARGSFSRTAADQSMEKLFGRLNMSSGTGGSQITPLGQTAAKLKHLGLKPVDVITDFLQKVREITMKSIGDSYDSAFVATSPVEYILTVPAIWSDVAKNNMVQAAQRAGFGVHCIHFHLISEPEAAAVYTFRAIQPHELRIGQSFVVCDAGGGTCDLVSYEIKQLVPLQVNEAVGGSGALCGSVFIDQGFDRYIRRTLGDLTVDRMKPRARMQMQDSFERVKTGFGNSDEDYYEINVPGLPDDDDLRIEDGYHLISTEDLKAIFDPVVNRIVNLVQDQVSEVRKKGKPVAAIVLVGGFGSSQYLKKRLSEATYGLMKIQVIQPANARTAIARGALMRGLDGSMVHEKRSRRYYGVTARVAYTDNLDEDVKDYLHWDRLLETMWVKGHLTWFLKKDAVVGDTFSATHQFVVTVPFDTPAHRISSCLKFDLDLKACDANKAPEYSWRDPTKVYKVCTLQCDLSQIPITRFPVDANCSGEKFYNIDLDVKLSLINDVLNFEVRYKGQQCGKVTAKFE